MKRFPLVLCALAISISAAHAGPDRYSSKEMTSPPPCPTWYADREWNVSLWGAYAFTAEDYPTLENANPFTPDPDVDRYLEADHAWGGGIDAKYFFKRFLGIGLEGFILDARQSYPDAFFGATGSVATSPFYFRTNYSRQTIGSALATFTLRYPMGFSRFAPYVWVGGGAIFGGGQLTRWEIRPGDSLVTVRSHSKTEAIGQFGGGFEVRLTPHIGLINDFSWNVIEGKNNNFGMVRTGINFAF